MKPRYIMLLDADHRTIGYVSSTDIVVEEECTGRFHLLKEVVIRAKQALLRMVKETDQPPGPKKDTSLEGWVCPFCGPSAQATHQETCAECGSNLGDVSSWFMERVQELEAELRVERKGIRPSERIYRIRRKSDGKWHGATVRFGGDDSQWHLVRGKYYGQPAVEQILRGWRLDPEPGVMSLRDIEVVVCEPVQVRVVAGEEIAAKGLKEALAC